jgi:RecB family exonuclease
MPRKPTLSPSRIATYLACPVKYMWTYLDERGRWYLRSRSYYSFGSTLHHVLQRFHDSGDRGVQTTQQALAAMEESWIEAGYASAQEMQEAMGEGKAILEAYIERVRMEASDAETVLIERQLRLDLGPFVLIGRVDRVDRWPDGSLEVVDYKSGRETVTDDEVATDLAMCCYQLLVGAKFPGAPVRASIVALRTGAKGTASLGAGEAEEFRRDLIRLGEEILNRDYEGIEPSWKDLCPDCDFLPLCRKHPAFEEPSPPPA